MTTSAPCWTVCNWLHIIKQFFNIFKFWFIMKSICNIRISHLFAITYCIVFHLHSPKYDLLANLFLLQIYLTNMIHHMADFVNTQDRFLYNVNMPFQPSITIANLEGNNIIKWQITKSIFLYKRHFVWRISPIYNKCFFNLFTYLTNLSLKIHITSAPKISLKSSNLLYQSPLRSNLHTRLFPVINRCSIPSTTTPIPFTISDSILFTTSSKRIKFSFSLR